MLPSLLLVLPVPVPPTFLQETPDPLAATDDLLEPTEVVAARSRAAEANATSSAAVTVVTGDQLRDSGAVNLPDALSRAAGVWVQQTNLGGGSVFLRGLTGNQILLLVDGVRINDATTRFGPNQSLNTIDPAIVDYVEIIKGPGSVLYGSDAIGGVIHIHTKRRRPVLGGGEAGLQGGISGQGQSAYEGGRMSIDASGATERNAWEAIVSGWKWNDLRAGGGETQEFTGYDGGAVFGAWEHQFARGSNLRFTASYNSDNDVPRTDKLVAGFGQANPSSQQYFFEVQDRQNYLLAYTDDRGGFADRAEYRLFYKQYDERRRRQKFGSTTLRLEQDKVQTFGAGVDWRKAVSDAHLLTWGLSVEDDGVDSSRVDIAGGVPTGKDGQFAPDSRYTSLGVFLQDEIFAFDAVDIVAGVRYSYYDWSASAFPSQAGSQNQGGNFDALTASLAAGGNLADGVRLTGKLAQGFRAPNLAELAKDGNFGGGVELHNPDLEPERSLTGEVGVDFDRRRWGTGLSVYYTDISDAIGRTLVDPGGVGVDPTYERNNQGKVVVYGLEWVFRHVLGAANSPWTALADASWTQGRQYDNTVDLGTGTAPLYDVPYRRIPPLFGSLALAWRPKAGKSAVSWSTLKLRLADRQDELHPQDITDPRIDPNGTPGWAVLDLDVGGGLGGSGASTWSVGLHNITDANYRVHGSGFDSPGINLVATLSWRP